MDIDSLNELIQINNYLNNLLAIKLIEKYSKPFLNQFHHILNHFQNLIIMGFIFLIIFQIDSNCNQFEMNKLFFNFDIGLDLETNLHLNHLYHHFPKIISN